MFEGGELIVAFPTTVEMNEDGMMACMRYCWITSS